MSISLCSAVIWEATSGTANIGEIRTPLTYAGPQGGTAGLSQFVMLLPRALARPGTVNISVTAGGHTSNTVTIGVM
jgi:uncharacterized protein (TIGR03437 family)